MLNVISPKISACQPGPIYLSFLMTVCVISFFLEIHNFIPLNSLCFCFFFFFFCRVQGETCCISKISLKTSCVSEPKPAFAFLHLEDACRKLLGTPRYWILLSEVHICRSGWAAWWEISTRGLRHQTGEKIKLTECLIFPKSHLDSVYDCCVQNIDIV